MTTMRAAVAGRYGSPEIVEIREVPRPDPGPREVRVRVHASTVSRTDCGNLRGTPRFARLFTGLIRPKHSVLGVDFAGVVDAVGEGVTSWTAGQRVFGIGPGAVGSHAQYLCVSAEGALAPLPDAVAFTDAVVGEGVWYALTYLDAFGLSAGHRILIYGGSGAIGCMAVQLAVARGAEVTAVVDGRSAQLMRDLGASRVIDYTQEDYTRAGDDYDFFFDAVGKARYREAKRLIRPAGVYSASDFGVGNENVGLIFRSKFMRTRKFIFPLPGSPKPAIGLAAAGLADGSLRAVVDRVVPLDAIVEAYTYVESAQKIGIVVVEP